MEITEPSKADDPQTTAGNTPQSQPHTIQLLPSTVKPATHNWGLWIGLVLLAALIVGWLVGILLAEPLRFAIHAPIAEAGIESTAMLSELFGALVLFLFPAENIGGRLRWVAGGFLILGIGSLCFGYLHPVVLGNTDLNASIYAWILAQLVAGIFFVAGLAPFRAPKFSRRLVTGTVVTFLALGTAVEYIPERLPALVETGDLGQIVNLGKTPVPWLSGWHWVFSTLPLVLAVIALVGVIYHRRRGTVGGWLVLAMVMLTGSELYNIFWPSAYSLTLTAADILRLGFAGVVIVGGVLELHRISSERAALLATEHERYQHLHELSTLKADFTQMVSHELVTPLCALESVTDMLATGALNERERAATYTTIKGELRSLRRLVEDVRTSAEVERDDFAVRLLPVALRGLLEDAATSARTLPGNHPVTIHIPDSVIVSADPERIGQVLRNLVSNAARYTPAQTSVELRAIRLDGKVRVEVADRGAGISERDLGVIFEKFARGRDGIEHRVPGSGLGLYISQRIVEAHGSELKVSSVPGEGSVFSFELEVIA